MSPSLMAIGAIVRAHGVRGTLRVRLYHAASEALDVLRTLSVGAPPIEYRLEEATPDRGGEWLVKLAGVDDRDGAEALRGAVVHACRDDLPAPSDGELFLSDLIGCQVVDLAGAPIGAVVRVDNYGAHDLLVVAREAAGRAEALIPFVEPIVIEVDLDARRVTCDPPEGLLDLDLPGPGTARAALRTNDGGSQGPR